MFWDVYYTKTIQSVSVVECKSSAGYEILRGRETRRGSSPTWLPICASTRTCPGAVEPEVCFRIVHIAQECHDGASVAPYREQTVEIALGPKGAFENGNIGALTRWLAADRVIRATPLHRGNPKPPKAARTPRVVELLLKAIEWQGLLESGEIANQADIARQEGISRARVTQIMGMLRLVPKIREQILSMPEMGHRPPISERMLRPIETYTDNRDQLREFQRFLV